MLVLDNVEMDGLPVFSWQCVVLIFRAWQRKCSE